MTDKIEPGTEIAGLAARLREGSLSIRALAEHYLGVIDAENGQLNAFRTVFRDSALARADTLQSELDAGYDRGPLHGIPFAIKDNIAFEGAVQGSGSLTQEAVATTTAPALRHLLDAGGIVLGQTKMVEFAFGGWGTNTALGTPWNALDRIIHRVPGGSSSGSGVAVAAHMVPFALGSDTGGSVRIPSAMNGLAGFKPSWGSVSSEGLTPLCELFDVVGPLAHNVADCGLVTRIMADGMDHAKADPVQPAKRIGIADIAAYGGCSPEIVALFATLYRRLADSGLELLPFRLPVTRGEILQQTSRIIGYEAHQRFGGIARTQGARMDRGARDRILEASRYSDADFKDACDRRQQRIGEMSQSLSGVDVFLFPTAPIVAPPVDQITEAEMPLGDLTRMVNYLDLCALALPFHTQGSALPHSLQIVGRKGADEQVLSTAAHIEALLSGQTIKSERNPDASDYQPA